MAQFFMMKAKFINGMNPQRRKKMRKTLAILAVMMMVSVLIIGCAGFGKWSESAQKVVDFICNPTAEQQQTAATMLAALDAGQAAGMVFIPALGIAKASAILTTIKNGGCFLVSELTEAFKVVDAANEAAAAKQMRMLKTAPAPRPEYPALRKLVK
jgi:amino acid permease